MSTQLTFGDGLVRNDHPDTAHQAAARANTGKTRAHVLRFLTMRATQGATDEEIIDSMRGYSENSVRPRRVELPHDGVIIDSGQRRKTRSGRQAIVWVAT